MPITVTPMLESLQTEFYSTAFDTSSTTHEDELDLSELVHHLGGVFLSTPVPPDPSWGKILPEWQIELLQLVNVHRASIGLNKLQIDPRLQACAEWKALNMAGYKYMDHNTPDPAWAGGRTVQQRFATYYPTNAAWGENIAYGFLTAQDVFNAWMSDVGHKANIEQPAYVGCGMAGAQMMNSTIVFQDQDFGSAPVSVTPPPIPSPTAPTVGQVWQQTSTRHMGTIVKLPPTGRVWWKSSEGRLLKPMQPVFLQKFTYVGM